MYYVSRLEEKKEYGLAPDLKVPGPARDQALAELVGKLELFTRRQRKAELKADLASKQLLIDLDALYPDTREEIPVGSGASQRFPGGA